ncbi:MAG TPA: thioredoxin family protein [Anaerolineales bacterium]|nr:thioredoxin family protein [Anaerolineales bacterium]
MSSDPMDIVLRFLLAIGIIGLGAAVYWYINYRLLLRAKNNIFTLFNRLPKKPVIVYFTTPDCVPCKTVQRPALDQIRSLLGEKLQVVEINAYERPDLAQRWGVMSVPTTFLLDASGEARYVNNGVARVEKLMEQVKTL